MRTQIYPLTKTNPYGLFSNFDNELRDFFFDTKSKSNQGIEWINHQVFESEKAYFFSMDLPGVKKEDLKINIEDDKITIVAERQIGFNPKDSKRVTEQTVLIPRNVNREKIEAHYEDGVLKLALHKIEKPQAKSIEVNFGDQAKKSWEEYWQDTSETTKPMEGAS